MGNIINSESIFTYSSSNEETKIKISEDFIHTYRNENVTKLFVLVYNDRSSKINHCIEINDANYRKYYVCFDSQSEIIKMCKKLDRGFIIFHPDKVCRGDEYYIHFVYESKNEK